MAASTPFHHNRNRLPTAIAIVASFLFVFSLLHQHRSKIPKPTHLWPFKDTRPTFYEIALKHGTDKVTDHSYQDMYSIHLPPLRDMKPLKMLEIGLGCDMSYGPGASYYTWLEYFPHVELYYIEYDAKCAAQWAHKTTRAKVFTGDQGDANFLNDFIRKTGGEFDVIIDDGGHTMSQQITSLKTLWRAVKPGGVYFCEDLQTSYWDAYGGGDTAKKTGNMTMMRTISMVMEDLTYGPRRVVFDEAELLYRVDCSREICGFWKRAEWGE